MKEILRADKNPANEGVTDNMATLFAFPEESTTAVDLSGLSFYQVSLYDFMTEEEELDI